VMNLLPIPALDGGRLLFLLIEAVRGKPVNPKYENVVHLIGFALFMLLFIYVTFNDILRTIGSG
jgi:regulator of sigma E protease